MQQVGRIIVAIARAEALTEQQRDIIADNLHSEPYTLYRRLDYRHLGRLDCDNIAQFLSECDVLFEIRELAYLFKKIDQDRDGRISYLDFQHFLLPRMNQQVKDQLSSRDSYSGDISVDLQYALCDLFRQEIKNYRTLVLIKEQLQLNQQIIEELRESILFYPGYVTIDSLMQFMTQIEPVSRQQCIEFCNSVSFISRLTFNHFIEAIHLMEPMQCSQVVESKHKHINSLQKLTKPTYPYYSYPYFERSGSIYQVSYANDTPSRIRQLQKSAQKSINSPIMEESLTQSMDRAITSTNWKHLTHNTNPFDYII